MADASEAREFQPVDVDESLCQALLCNRGFGKMQCGYRPLKGSDLCKKHVRYGAPHGKVRGPIPQKKFEEFKKVALNPKESVQWYSRHLMWQYASEMVRGQGGAELEYLNEKDAEGRYKLTDQMYEACLKRM